MEDDGTYVRIGTVVEQPVEDEEISLKPVRVEDQTVKDAQGRRRFHGAFTGGFSAGYYNTVGTKEGRLDCRCQWHGARGGWRWGA